MGQQLSCQLLAGMAIKKSYASLTRGDTKFSDRLGRENKAAWLGLGLQ